MPSATNKIKILYVEDEPALANIVKDTLENKHYEVSLVADGNTVLEEARRFGPDLCLLDVMLPNVDGFTLGKQIRNLLPHLPIIYLTAKNQTADVVKGFQSGGNDYLKKPFSLEELLIRMENLLHLKNGIQPIKSTTTADQQIIPIGQYQFRPGQLLLTRHGSDRKLTHRESEVIQVFARHINGVVNKKELLLQVWGDDTFYNTRSLDVYINKLRDFFSEDPNISILTLRGVGYRFNVE